MGFLYLKFINTLDFLRLLESAKILHCCIIKPQPTYETGDCKISSALLTMIVALQVIAARVNSVWLVSGKQPCFVTLLFMFALQLFRFQ